MDKIIFFKNIKSNENFGGKVNGLLQLIKLGCLVPEFYVIPNNLLVEIVNNHSILNEVLNNWKKENLIVKSDLFAVRSSAEIEDGVSKSFAGLFKTELNCSFLDLENAIISVYDGFIKTSKLNYTEKKDFKFHIIIQKMVLADYSGVIFSKNPTDRSDKSTIINLIPGAGSSLVNGDENAFGIKKSNRKIEFVNIQDNYFGKNPITDEIILKSFFELKKVSVPFINKLFRIVKKLELECKKAIDVEFSIKDRKIFWLQLRPITTVSEIYYWDNTGISENYSGISMPLTITFVKESYYIGYSNMLQYLCSNERFIEKNKIWLNNMVGGINGVLYYNVTAWQKLLFQMPFGTFTSKAITRLLCMPDASFDKPKKIFSILNYFLFFKKTILAFLNFKTHKKKYLTSIDEIIIEEKNKDYSSLSHKELVSLFYLLQKKMTTYWIAPLLNGFFTLFFYGTLKKTIEKSKIVTDYPNFTNDILFDQGEVISVKIVHELRKIISKIYEDESLLIVFRSCDLLTIKNKVAELNIDLHNQIIHYIEHFGDRSEEGELRMETINYRENPDLFWKMLQENVQLAPLKTEINKRKKFDYKSIIKKNYPSNFLKRLYLIFMIKNTIQRMKDRENFRFLRTQTFSIFRRIFRAIDQRLFNEKLILSKGDSLYLEFNEILNVNLSSEYKQIIQERKKLYTNFSTAEMPSRYFSENNNFIPVFPSFVSKSNHSLKGIGCCSGVVRGKISIISSNNFHATNWENRIIIAKNFQPGWINIFANAKGLISERGSLLSHTSILCRELYIPSIVGVSGLLKLLKDGDYIEMDGATGIINIIENE